LSDAREILDELKGNRDDEEDRGCSLCGADLEQVRGMSITALCFDGELWDLSHTCTKCEEAMHQALSPETRQEHDRFMETHFPEPPFMEKTPDEPVQDERPDDSTRAREDSWVGSEALGCAVNLKANSSAPDFGGR